MNKHNIIIACDFSQKRDLLDFLGNFNDHTLFVKIGLEAIYSMGLGIVDELKKRNYKVMLDLKLHDIPTTVAKAVRSLLKHEPDYITIHAQGGLEMLRAAQIMTEKSQTQIIAVSLLTSINEIALQEELQINKNPSAAVEHFYKIIKTAGIKNVVCAAHDSELAMQKYNFTTFVPGIRMHGIISDDQKRVTTPENIRNRANYIILGRALTMSANPLNTYHQIIHTISK